MRNPSDSSQPQVRIEHSGLEGASFAAPDGAGTSSLFRLLLHSIPCDGCADEIECELHQLDGVLTARLHHEGQQLELILDPQRVQPEQIERVLVAMGYLVERRTGAPLDWRALVERAGGKGVLDVLPGTAAPERSTAGREATDTHDWHSATAHHNDAEHHHPEGDHGHGDHSEQHGHHAHGLSCVHPPYRPPTGTGRWVMLLGTVSGVVCLIHCAAMPVLLTAVAVLPGLGKVLGGGVEHALVAFTLVLAWVSVGASVRTHRRYAPLMALIFGSLLTLLTHISPLGTSGREMALELVGTLSVVGSIWWNRYYLNRAPLPIEVSEVSMQTAASQAGG